MKRPVIHFEIGCDHLDETARFYTEVFKWEINKMGPAAYIGQEGTNGIPGHITELGHAPRKYITFYIETTDIDGDLDKIEANGGKRQVGPIDLSDGRSFAWFEDIAGNTVGLITPNLQNK